MSNLSLQQQNTEQEIQRIINLEQAVLAQELLNMVANSGGAISPPTAGQVESTFVTYGAAGAYTLANPASGKPLPGGAGGQDGSILEITSTTAFAHTITTGTNGVNASKHIITFPATAGTTIRLKAFNGSWWVQLVNGVTLS